MINSSIKKLKISNFGQKIILHNNFSSLFPHNNQEIWHHAISIKANIIHLHFAPLIVQITHTEKQSICFKVRVISLLSL